MPSSIRIESRRLLGPLTSVPALNASSISARSCSYRSLVQYSEAQAKLDKSVKPSAATPTLGSMTGNSFTTLKIAGWTAVACDQEALDNGLAITVTCNLADILTSGCSTECDSM